VLQSAQKIGGRAFAIAVWVTGMGTIVMLTMIYLFSEAPIGQRDWTAIGGMIGAFFFMLGLVGGAAYAPNAAERLPGTRRYENQYRGHGMDRRTTDDERVSDAES